MLALVNVLVNILGMKSIQNVKPGLKFPCAVQLGDAVVLLLS